MRKEDPQKRGADVDLNPQQTALLLIHIQNDFLPGGSLAVPGGDTIISPANSLIREFVENNAPILATRDWHPEDHISFMERGGPWPCHCVRETRGSEFPEALKLPDSAIVFSKYMDTDEDQYSAFRGRNYFGFDLETYLRFRNVNHLVAAGIALDVCVLATLRDALDMGFGVTLATDATKAIDPEAGERALKELSARGVRLATSAEIINELSRAYA